MIKFYFLVILALLVGCASAPSKPPKIDPKNMPVLEWFFLKPRAVTLMVTGARKINEEAKNTQEVADAVMEAAKSTMEKSKINVVPGSINRLTITISDYTGAGAEGECVGITSEYAYQYMEVAKVEASACHTMQNAMGMKFGGDISQAYERALTMSLGGLEKYILEFGRKTGRFKRANEI